MVFVYVTTVYIFLHTIGRHCMSAAEWYSTFWSIQEGRKLVRKEVGRVRLRLLMAISGNVDGSSSNL
jgi:hypothetical protein